MEKRWGYQDAIEFAKQERQDHPVPWVKINQNADETLDFGEVNGASNKELEAYLAIYGGNKAILEQVVASHQMKLGAMNAQFDEGYNVAFAQVMKDATGKKPTLKEFVQNKKRRDKAARISDDPQAQMDDVIARQGEMLDDDVSTDFASGGIARMLGE